MHTAIVNNRIGYIAPHTFVPDPAARVCDCATVNMSRA